MRNISENRRGENQNTHFMFNNFFFFDNRIVLEEALDLSFDRLLMMMNRVVYEIMWKKKVVRSEHATEDIIRRTRFACWLTKATDTHSVYVMHISFARQQ